MQGTVLYVHETVKKSDCLGSRQSGPPDTLRARAVAIALSTRQRREATGSLIIAGLVLAIASIAAFGTGVWREAVDAQLQVGNASLHYAGGLIAQGAIYL